MVRTRSGTSVGGNDHGESVSLLENPRVPVTTDLMTETSVTNCWYLTVYHERRGAVNIHVFPGMKSELLARCILQATDMSLEELNLTALVGLFGRDGIFLSLDHLVRLDESSIRTYQRFYFEPPKSVPTEITTAQNDLVPIVLLLCLLALVPVALIALARYYWSRYQIGPYCVTLSSYVYEIMSRFKSMLLPLQTVVEINLQDLLQDLTFLATGLSSQLAKFIIMSLEHIYLHFITEPLKDLYRLGPTFLGGWEGATLPSICARITFGDEEFWSRNLEDCHKMYESKERAFLYVARPALYLLAFILVGYFFLQWYSIRERERRLRSYDRDMVETYRAMQMLLHQTAKMIQR